MGIVSIIPITGELSIRFFMQELTGIFDFVMIRINISVRKNMPIGGSISMGLVLIMPRANVARALDTAITIQTHSATKRRIGVFRGSI